MVIHCHPDPATRERDLLFAKDQGKNRFIAQKERDGAEFLVPFKKRTVLGMTFAWFFRNLCSRKILTQKHRGQQRGV
jgi:hypothetical protein